MRFVFEMAGRLILVISTLFSLGKWLTFENVNISFFARAVIPTVLLIWAILPFFDMMKEGERK